MATTNAERRRTYRQAHPEKIAAADRAKNQRRKVEAIAAYGGACACCGETEIAFLTIDHPEGGGTTHRALVGAGSRFYKWLRRNGYPDGYRVLCANCNTATSHGRTCPHQLEEARVA